jgi:hypothetical protein
MHREHMTMETQSTTILNTDDKLKRIDMGLLLQFEAMMRERNQRAAGRSLGLTQSTISKPMNRLKAIFDDELFTTVDKHGRADVTPRAVDLGISVWPAAGSMDTRLS